MKVCSVSNYFSPYKIKLFIEIGKSVELTAVILSGDDGNRNSEWMLPEDVRFKTYVIDKNYSKLIKKLAKENDILIDSKIPKEQKDLVPIMVDSKNKVLWVLGLKKSKYDIEKNGNYDIIYKYTKEEE